MIHIEIHGLDPAAAKKVRTELLAILTQKDVVVTDVGDEPKDYTGATYQFLRLFSQNTDEFYIKSVAASLGDLGMDIEIVPIAQHIPAKKHFRYI